MEEKKTEIALRGLEPSSSEWPDCVAMEVTVQGAPTVYLYPSRVAIDVVEHEDLYGGIELHIAVELTHDDIKELAAQTEEYERKTRAVG